MDPVTGTGMHGLELLFQNYADQKPLQKLQVQIEALPTAVNGEWLLVNGYWLLVIHPLLLPSLFLVRCSVFGVQNGYR